MKFLKNENVIKLLYKKMMLQKVLIQCDFWTLKANKNETCKNGLES